MGKIDRKKFLATWEQISAWPLIGLSIAYLALYAAPIAWPEFSAPYLDQLEIAQNTIWAIFIADFAVRIGVATERWNFFKRNFIDFLSVLLPLFRPLRFVRLFSVITIASRRFGARVRHRVTLYVGTMALFVWFICGLAVTEAERGVDGSNIHSAADGLWWSFITMATVGYGDKYPVSDEGRLVGVVIVLAGLALLGTISASIAAWFMDEARTSREETKRLDSEILRSIEALQSQISQLQKAIKPNTEK